MGRKENWLKQRMKRMIKAPPSEDYCGAGNDGDHAREIARATQVATEAAVKAANAAAVVLRLINIQPEWSREDLAAIKIQAAYRGHLAKHALRALKGVVKLQALFRGYLVRRQAKMVLHCMETLVRLQHRVRSRTLLNSVNSQLNGGEFGET